MREKQKSCFKNYVLLVGKDFFFIFIFFILLFFFFTQALLHWCKTHFSHSYAN